MRLPPLRQVPLRAATGAHILNTGLSKWHAPAEQAAQLHGFASGTYPFLKRLEPEHFARLLSGSEIALGAALLVPVVPSVVAGAALTAFSGGLLGLYLKTPGMRQPGSLRPTAQATALFKDVWLLGIGLGLVVDEMSRSKRR
jgi:hypothetical protein